MARKMSERKLASIEKRRKTVGAMHHGRRESVFAGKIGDSKLGEEKHNQIKYWMLKQNEMSFCRKWFHLDSFFNPDIYKGGLIEFVASYLYIHLGRFFFSPESDYQRRNKITARRPKRAREETE